MTDAMAKILGAILMLGAMCFVARWSYDYAVGPAPIVCQQDTAPHLFIGGFFFVRL